MGPIIFISIYKMSKKEKKCPVQYFLKLAVIGPQGCGKTSIIS